MTVANGGGQPRDGQAEQTEAGTAARAPRETATAGADDVEATSAEPSSPGGPAGIDDTETADADADDTETVDAEAGPSELDAPLKELEATLGDLGLPRRVVDELLAEVAQWTELEHEAVVHELARRLVEAAHGRTTVAYRYDRLRNRRGVRAVTLLADALRGRASWPQLRALLTRPDRHADEAVPVARVLTEAMTAPDLPGSPKRPRFLRRVARDRRPRYPHLQIGHVGSRRTFVGVAPHVALPGRPWQDEVGYDLVVVEPDAGALPLSAPELAAVLGRVGAPRGAGETEDGRGRNGDTEDGRGRGDRADAEAGPERQERPAPVVLVARDPADLLALDMPDVVVAFEPAVADAARERFVAATVLDLLPGVDTTTFNPRGWQSRPATGVLAYVERVPQGAPLPDPADDVVGVLQAAGLEVRPAASAAAATHAAGPGAGRQPADRPERQPADRPERQPADRPERQTADRPERTAAGGGVGTAIASSRQLTAAIHHSRVVFADPAWHPGEAAFLGHVLGALAAGTPVLARPSPRLEALAATETLPALHFVRDAGDARAALAAVADPLERERASVVTRRAVLQRHTTGDRFDAVLAALGVPQRAPETVSIILSTKRPHFLAHALANVARQDYPAKELILVLHGDGFDRARVDALAAEQPYPVRVLALPAERAFGDCLNAGIAAAGGALVLKIDDDDVYGPAFVTDLVQALEYTGAAVVGKYARFAYLVDEDVTLSRTRDLAEEYRKKVSGATMLMRRDVAERFGFLRRSSRVDATFCRRIERAGGTLYVTHPFDFVFCRHGSGHTWTPAEGHFEEGGPNWPGLATGVVFTAAAADGDRLVRWAPPP